ncbi:MAG: serine acetyltransferase [Colwellia sp.]|jgi:serine acetyltransferase
MPAFNYQYIKRIFHMSKLHQDYLVYIEQHELIVYSNIKRLLSLVLRTTFVIVLFYRLANSDYKIVKWLSIPIYKLIRIISGVQIPRNTQIGGGLYLPHFGMIVLNQKAKYGDFLTIYHGVTVGAKGGGNKKDFGLPIIGNNVRIATGAIVLGSISIGDNALIGAGAVVVKSIPSNSIAVGNPAKFKMYMGN